MSEGSSYTADRGEISTRKAALMRARAAVLRLIRAIFFWDRSKRPGKLLWPPLFDVSSSRQISNGKSSIGILNSLAMASMASLHGRAHSYAGAGPSTERIYQLLGRASRLLGAQ